MAIFLQILDGESPSTAKAIFATRDQEAIKATMMALVDKICGFDDLDGIPVGGLVCPVCGRDMADGDGSDCRNS